MVEPGQYLIAGVTASGFIASWIGFRVSVLTRMVRIEQDLRDAFGPNGRIQRIEDVQNDQGKHLQRILGRLESMEVFPRPDAR